MSGTQRAPQPPVTRQAYLIRGLLVVAVIAGVVGIAVGEPGSGLLLLVAGVIGIAVTD